MTYMFNGCTEFNQDLDNWDLKSLKQCIKMFHKCCSYLYPLFSWTDYDIIINTPIFDRAINKKIQSETNLM
jgi:surface protein